MQIICFNCIHLFIFILFVFSLLFLHRVGSWVKNFEPGLYGKSWMIKGNRLADEVRCPKRRGNTENHNYEKYVGTLIFLKRTIFVTCYFLLGNIIDYYYVDYFYT